MAELLERRETPMSYLEYYSDGLIRHSYKDNAIVDAEEAERVINICNDFCQGAPLLLCNDMRGKVSFSREARNYFRDNSPPDTCMAFVLDSKVSEMAVNFFLKFNEPEYQLRVFSDLDEAMDWLRSNRSDED